MLKSSVVIIGITMVVVGSSAFASSGQDNGRNYSAGIGISVLSDDNVYTESSSEDTDLITEYSPSFDYLLNKDGNEYAFSVNGKFGDYNQSKDDDYEDYTFKGGVKLALGSSGRLELGFDQTRDHDDRGTQGSEFNPFVSDDPDVYDRQQISALLGFGQSDTTFGIDVYGRTFDKEYQNNRTETLERDYDRTTIGTIFYFRASGKSRWLLEYRLDDIDYDIAVNTASLDGEESAWFVGFTWELTGVTTGTAKIGRSQKEFDVAGLRDQDATSVEVGLDWTPQAQDKVYVDVNRGFRETDGFGDAILTQRVALGWNHAWNGHFASDVKFVHLEEEYDPTLRWDRTDFVTLSATYNLRRSLDVIMATTHTFKDSHTQFIDYERAQYSLTVQLGI